MKMLATCSGLSYSSSASAKSSNIEVSSIPCISCRSVVGRERAEALSLLLPVSLSANKLPMQNTHEVTDHGTRWMFARLLPCQVKHSFVTLKETEYVPCIPWVPCTLCSTEPVNSNHEVNMNDHANSHMSGSQDQRNACRSLQLQTDLRLFQT